MRTGPPCSLVHVSLPGHPLRPLCVTSNLHGMSTVLQVMHKHMHMHSGIVGREHFQDVDVRMHMLLLLQQPLQSSWST